VEGVHRMRNVCVSILRYKFFKLFIVIILAILIIASVIRFVNSSLILKFEIAFEYPQILSSNTNDEKRVIILRQWAYEHIDWSSRSDLIDQNKSFGFYSKKIQDIYKAYSNDKGGVWCGGAAYSLMQLYKLYGYKSYTVDIGKVDVMTHVINLVEVKLNGKEVYMIQDPTFNVTYTDLNDTPIDYFDFLRLLKENKDDKIKIESGTSNFPDFIFNPKDNIKDYSQFIMENDKPIKNIDSERIKYKSKLTLDSFTKKFGDSIFKYLKQEDHPEKIIYLYLYPLSITGESDANSLIYQAKTILEK
jgi:hypothetical protein